ncbi:MAG: hypothetical protein WC331_11130 [Candidatus Omnitrophota bacterium]|jgi:hypothetical protein
MRTDYKKMRAYARGGSIPISSTNFRYAKIAAPKLLSEGGLFERDPLPHKNSVVSLRRKPFPPIFGSQDVLGHCE